MENRRRYDDIWARYEKRVRDGAIFVVGILGVINELFWVPEPRPAALVFLSAMIGVPFVLSADERKSKPERKGTEDEDEDAR